MYLTFENPLYLWFLFLIPILILSHYYFLKHSRSKALIFSNIQALRRVAKGSLISANLTHLVIRSLVIFAMVIAASGTTLWVIGDRADTSIIFALDSSASMTSQDIGSSRFESAKSIISGIVSSAPGGIDYALINFAGVSFIKQSFTSEPFEFLLALEDSSILRLGGTDVSSAIITATNLFELRPERGKILIIISDGLDNAGAFISSSPQETIDYAKNNQVVIHSIAIGSEGGPIGFLPEYFQIPSMFDDELMILLSEGTGGEYFRVDSVEVIPSVVASLDIESSRAYVNYNLYYWAFLLVFVLLIFEWIIANTIYRRVL